MEFNQLEVLEVRKETADSVSIAFKIPADLKTSYSFIPGQYLTISKEINNTSVRRSYSICSFGENEPLRIAIKEVPSGVFSSYANNDLNAGDKLDVSLPEGNFIHKASSEEKQTYIAFVAGSGITPVLSILKSVLQNETDSRFFLFYGNRYSNSIIFKEELENLKDQYLNRLSIFHVLSKEKMDAPLFEGRINSDKCTQWLNSGLINPAEVSKVFLCGPFDMIMGLNENLPKLGIDSNKIKFELFYNPNTDENGVKTELKKELGEAYNIKVTLDGQTTEIKTNYLAPILDIAADYGLDTPYSCKGGVCATCKAKVLEGEVEMQINYALEEEEVEAGYVLTCQALCKSKNVHINFDI